MIKPLRHLLLIPAIAALGASAQEDGGGAFDADGFFVPGSDEAPGAGGERGGEFDADGFFAPEGDTDPGTTPTDAADAAGAPDDELFAEPEGGGLRFDDDLADEFRPWKLGGYVGAEARWFFEDARYPDQLDGFQPSLLLQPELSFETRDGRHQFRLTPFFRYDAQDSQRTHFDLREANWRLVGDGWDLLAGVGKVYWGVAESRHLVDVINQVDAVEDIDEEDKLGQPMLNLNLTRDWGTLGLFAMTGFRERSFPGAGGRLRPGLPVRDDDAIFESGLEHWYPEFALRYQHTLGGFDIGAHYFHGTGREPTFVPSADGTFLRPRYEIINQVGLDLQYTKDAWLWKLEAIGREGHGSPFLASVAGVEYTFFGAFGGSADLGLLFEHLYDGRDADAPPTAFDNDLFAGARLALNDTQDTSLLAGAIFDPSDSTAAILLEAERRLGDRWKVELEARVFAGPADEGSAYRDLAEDSFVALRLTRHF